jgi:hypothetical protein
MLQGAFLHPHFEILEVKKQLIGHLKLPPCARRIKKTHLREFNNNLTRFGSGVIVRRQDLRLLVAGP